VKVIDYLRHLFFKIGGAEVGDIVLIHNWGETYMILAETETDFLVCVPNDRLSAFRTFSYSKDVVNANHSKVIYIYPNFVIQERGVLSAYIRSLYQD
jgi:hypothetical protein